MAPTKSEYWRFFNKLNSNEVKCKICFKTFKTSGNTSNMKKHLFNQHPRAISAEHENDGKKQTMLKTPQECSTQQDQQDNSIVEDGCSLQQANVQFCNIDLTTEPISSSAIKRQLSIAQTIQRKQSFSDGGKDYSLLCKNLLYFICVDKRPFDIVKGRGFQKLMHKACPSFKIPSTETLKRQLDNLYTVIREKVETKFESLHHIALTTDIWTETMTTTSYLGVTAHYNQGNTIISRCIATIDLDERHTANFICEKLQEVCSNMHITIDKIVNIVTDNGANMMAGVKKLVGPSKHSSCFAHSINLVCEATRKVEDFNTLCGKIRAIVIFVKTSVVQSDLLRKRQIGTPLKLILDVKTRWNSLYYMLERYVELASILHPILILNANAPSIPSAVEIEHLKLLIKLFKPLEHVSKELSGQQYVTVSKVIPVVNCLKAQMEKVYIPSDAEMVEHVKNVILSEIQHRFKDVENVNMYSIPCLLDPRFKQIHFRNASAREVAISKIRQLTKDVSLNNSCADTSSTDSSVDMEFDFWSHHKTLAHSNKNNKIHKGDAYNLSNDEISSYLSTPVTPLSTNPFLQWEEMKMIFPNLYHLAKKYLISPATSVPAERLFSKAGFTMSKTRNRLTCKRLDKLLFLSDCTEEEWEM